MTAPIKTCDFCNATGVMPTFMDGTTVCYDCLPKLPKTLKEAWREMVSLRKKIERMERALSFYADEARYCGPNQRYEGGDYWTDAAGLQAYQLDVTRDRGEIARTALEESK